MTTKSAPPMPTWLKNQLIDKGVWNTDGIHRKARLAIHTCGHLVLTGLSADTCAWPTTCDPTWLTPLGEALAAIDHRHTYDYWTTAQHLNGPRDAQRITWRPASDDGPTRVLPQHVCGTPPLPHYPAPPTTTKETTDDPPY